MPDTAMIYQQALEITQNYQHEILVGAGLLLVKIGAFSAFIYLIIKTFRKILPYEITQNIRSVIFAMAMLASVAQLPDYYHDYHITGIYQLKGKYISTVYSCAGEVCDSYDIFAISELTAFSENQAMQALQVQDAQIACNDFVITRFVNRELKKLRHEIEANAAQLILEHYPKMNEHLRQQVEKQIVSNKEIEILQDIKSKELTIITLTFGDKFSFLNHQNTRYQVIPYMIWDKNHQLIYQRNHIQNP